MPKEKEKRDGRGRPPKYDHVLRTLQDEALYSPAMIADLAVTQFFQDKSSEERKLIRQRIRVTLAHMARRYFPAEGDGWIKLPGQCPRLAWNGARWKSRAK